MSLGLFLAFFIAMLIGIPVAASLGLALVGTSIISDRYSLAFIARSAISMLDSFPILAVPMFILAGEVMGQGGISRRLFNFANAIMGRFTGGVPMATILTCMLFGAISGSAQATFAAIGTLMIPLMKRQGYDERFVTGLTASSGGLGILIPPSLPMVMYGISSQASIGSMFIAGILPGVLTGLALMIFAYFYCRRHPLGHAPEAEERLSIWVSFKDGFWALLSPVIILGGIYTGTFTPTEAAGVSVVYGIVISRWVYKSLSFNQMPNILLRAAKINAPVLLILCMATVFGRVLSMMKVPTEMANFLLSISNDPLIILLLINVLLIVAGMFMETLASIVILTPILLPIALQIGLSPIHFGVIMVANLAIGFVTPPIGVNLYTAAALTGLPISDVVKSAIGPVIALLIALVFIVACPWLSLGLLDLLSK